MATKKKTDLSAALTGLVLGSVTLFLLLTSIVLLTNAHFRGHPALARRRLAGGLVLAIASGALW
jgi:hypothetical protein